MGENTIKEIQKRIIGLLPIEWRDRPGIPLADSCSEVSRLVAGWIKKIDESSRILMMKSVDVCNTQKAHDILAVTIDNQIYVIDPTIWQFFPQAKSILVCVSDNINVALDKIKETYGGEWKKSEEFTQIDKNKEKEYLDIIYKNIYENSQSNN
jgi:hypothetical protein